MAKRRDDFPTVQATKQKDHIPRDSKSQNDIPKDLRKRHFSWTACFWRQNLSKRFQSKEPLTCYWWRAIVSCLHSPARWLLEIELRTKQQPIMFQKGLWTSGLSIIYSLLVRRQGLCLAKICFSLRKPPERLDPLDHHKH